MNSEKPRKIECFGGPLCGTKIPDTGELWLGIQHVRDEKDTHFYKRMLLVHHDIGKQVLVWHYHGSTPFGDGMKILMPHRRKFREPVTDE